MSRIVILEGDFGFTYNEVVNDTGLVGLELIGDFNIIKDDDGVIFFPPKPKTRRRYYTRSRTTRPVTRRRRTRRG